MLSRFFVTLRICLKPRTIIKMLLELLIVIFELIEDDLLDLALEKLEHWDVKATETKIDDAVREKLVGLVRLKITRRAAINGS